MECEKAQRMIFVSWFPKVLPFENGVYIAGTKRLILYYLLYSIVLHQLLNFFDSMLIGHHQKYKQVLNRSQMCTYKYCVMYF